MGRKYNPNSITKHPLYSTWEGMKARCYNPKNRSYRYCGSKGIVVCEEWKHNADIFIKWCMDNGWQLGLQIDRKDNSGNYSPDNCRIVTARENQGNTTISNNRVYPVGVIKYFNRFIARIKIKGKQTHIGTFDTPEQASKAYQHIKQLLEKK